MLVGDDSCVISGVRKEEGNEKEEIFSILFALADQLQNGWPIDQILGWICFINFPKTKSLTRTKIIIDKHALSIYMKKYTIALITVGTR